MIGSAIFVLTMFFCYYSSGLNYSEEVQLVRSTYNYLDDSSDEKVIRYITTCTRNADTDRWYKACNCGQACRTYGECCNDTAGGSLKSQNFQSEPATPNFKIDYKTSLFEIYKYESDYRPAINIYVKKPRCSEEWIRDDVRRKCERTVERNTNNGTTINFDNGNITLILRATVLEKNLTYPNLFCALCNGENEYEIWDVAKICTDDLTCEYFLRPTERIYFSIWFHWPANFTAKRIRDNLEETKTKLYGLKLNLFYRYFDLKDKLEHESARDLPTFSHTVGNRTFHIYENIMNASLKLFDQTRPINKFQRSLDDIFKNNRPDLLVCEDSMFYDPFAKKRRKIICYSNDECIKFPLKADEFDITERGLLLNSYNRTFPWSRFWLYMNGTAEVCLEDAIEGASAFKPYTGVLTSIGIAVSVVSLIMHLTVHVFCVKTYTLPLNNLASFSLSLLMAHISFSAGNYLSFGSFWCKIDAIVTHYFFLVSFVWTSIMSYDVLSMLHNSVRKFRIASGKRTSRFLAYSIVGWLLPFTITGCAVSLDIHTTLLQVVPADLRPEFGKICCWFKNGFSAFVFFICPVFTSIAFNALCFVQCVYIINREKNKFPTGGRKEESAVNKKRESAFLKYFRTCCKLSVITGFTWTSAFIAAYFDEDFLWNIFIVLNAYQGAFIFLTFTDKNLLLAGIKTGFTVKIEHFTLHHLDRAES